MLLQLTKIFPLLLVMSLLATTATANDQPPTADWSHSEGSASTFMAGTYVVFDGSLSHDNDEYGNSITYYSWYVDGMVKSQGSSASSFGWTFALETGITEKSVQIKLRVRDDEGNWDGYTQTYTIRQEPGRAYYVKDHLGNVRVTVDEDGNAIGWDDYYPFGKVMPGRSSNHANPNDVYKFTGHEFDQEAGLDLIYAGARYMDPEIGRWLGVDPLASKYPSLSPYNYVANNPMIAFDPDGEDIWFVHGTWSDPSTWQQNNAVSLWEHALNDNIYRRDGIPLGNFAWSGGNYRTARTSAAESLASQIAEAKDRNPEMLVQLVAHSHGGNVAIEAARILKENDITVDRLVLLGTPSRNDYQITGGSISEIVNVFNQNDLIQIAGGFDRMGAINKINGTFADRKRSQSEGAVEINVTSRGENGPIESHVTIHNSQELIDFIDGCLNEDKCN